MKGVFLCTLYTLFDAVTSIKTNSIDLTRNSLCTFLSKILFFQLLIKDFILLIVYFICFNGLGNIIYCSFRGFF